MQSSGLLTPTPARCFFLLKMLFRVSLGKPLFYFQHDQQHHYQSAQGPPKKQRRRITRGKREEQKKKTRSLDGERPQPLSLSSRTNAAILPRNSLTPCFSSSVLSSLSALPPSSAAETLSSYSPGSSGEEMPPALS